MVMKNISLAIAVAILSGGVVLAQPKPATPTMTPAAPSATTPTTTAPTRAARPATATSSTVPSGTKIDLNTATVTELDSLPEIGAARTKVIMSERAKGKFKDWADFDTRMAHTSVNKGVRTKIKDHVTF
jgi:DNA uptake protein ComE-like DNA-binding protein